LTSNRDINVLQPIHASRRFGFRRFVRSMELSSVNCSPRDQIVPDSCNGNNWANEQLDFNWQMQVSHERAIRNNYTTRVAIIAAIITQLDYYNIGIEVYTLLSGDVLQTISH